MASQVKDIIALEEKLAKYEGEDKIVSSLELAEIISKEKAASVSHPTGIPTIDRILENVEGGELIVVSGPTGNGKTTLLTSITANTAAVTRSAWFTLEVTQKQFLAKFGDNLPLFYTPAKNTDNNIQWLIERIIEAKVKYDVQMVFIDHLHQLFSVDKFNGKNLSLELGDIVAKIKQIALDYELAIWLVAHSTDDKERVNREPKMIDIRDSGMISRLADIVMGVWRIPNDDDGTKTKMREINETDNRAKVRIWKNRRTGKLGYLVMQMMGKNLVELDKNRLTEADEEFEEF